MKDYCELIAHGPGWYNINTGGWEATILIILGKEGNYIKEAGYSFDIHNRTIFTPPPHWSDGMQQKRLASACLFCCFQPSFVL